MRYLKHSLYIGLFALIMASCQSSAPSPTSTDTQTVTQTPSPDYPMEGYPAGPTPTLFDYTSDTGYPIPESTPFYAEYPDSLEIPTPEADTGIITGQLLTPGPGGQPFYNPLYLANTIPASIEGYPPVIALSEADAPSSIQDKEGRFLFVNIPPGTYALALWSPVASTIIQDPDIQDYLLIEVRAGEITDLGVIGIP
jgi:hypothetical protein